MTTRLDEAIDQVAMRMTAVEDDDALAARIAQALPDRSRWLPFGWIPRFAVGALAMIAIIAFVREFGPAKAGHHNGGVAVIEAGIASATSAESGVTGIEATPRRFPVASAFRRTRTGSVIAVDRADHEFSLPAIAAVPAMHIDALAPANLAEDAPLTVESLQIVDLPLTADFSPR